MSYDTATKQAKILDQANHFNSVLNARGAIYYATSNPGGSNTVLKIMPDGTKKQVLLTKEVFSIYRTAYNDISFATATSWYRMSLSDTTPMLTTNAYSGSGLLYIDAPDGRHSARVVSNGTVYIYDTKTSKETTLTTQTGASYPMHWLSNSTFSLRVDTAKETADYAVNITDGKTTKIVDVSTIAGMQLWQ